MIAILLLFFVAANCIAYDRVVDIRQSRYQTYYVDAVINGQETDMLFDTGSAYTVIPKSLVRKMHLVEKKTITAILADGRRTRANVYSIPLIAISECTIHNVEAVVLPGNVSIFGMSAISKISPVSFNPIRRTLEFQCNMAKTMILHCRGCRVY